jgi:hypothetical protein
MANPKLLTSAKDVFQGVFAPQKIAQTIFNVQTSSTPTTVRITFVPMLDCFAFVTLYQDGVQIRGGWALPYDPAHYGVTFTDLPQDTGFGFTIAVTDPRPKAQQIPGGIVTYSGIVEAGLRTATVHLSKLTEVVGEAEITYLTRLYDATSGSAISPVVQYGRAHMDPQGSPIGDPFGPPISLALAPDSLAVYTAAGAETSSTFIQFLGLMTGQPGDLGSLAVLGIEPGPEFPNDGPSLRDFQYYAVMAGQKILRLPDAEGSFNIRFWYGSASGDYVFQIDGNVNGVVTRYNHPGQRSMMWHPGHLKVATALPYSPHASVAAGDGLLSFALTVGGAVARPRVGARTRADLESIGEIGAERLVVVGRADGAADLLAVRQDGAVLHARAGTEGAVEWQELGAKLAEGPAVVRAPDGALHVFGLDAASTLVHTVLAGNAARAARWERWGEGFSGRLSCACNRKGEAHVFARRAEGIVHARLALRRGKIKPPRWETIEAPFAGPAMVGDTEDGCFTALGCDHRGIFWVKTWDGRRWQPQGRKWERIGTADDLLATPNPKKATRPQRGARPASEKRRPAAPGRRRSASDYWQSRAPRRGGRTE